MKISIHKYYILFFLACILAFPINANSITIDEFDGTSSVNANSGAPVQSQVVSSAKSIGGKRSMKVQWTGGAQGITLNSQFGFLNHSQDGGVTGQSIVAWDGDNTADNTIVPSSPAGLGNLNLLQDGADSFKLVINSFDYPASLPVSISVFVYDASGVLGDRSSFATVTLNQVIAADTNVFIPFANFAQSPGAVAPAVFSNIGAIVLQINGSNPAIDFTLSHFSTNGECDTFPSNGTVYTACNKCINAPNNLDCLDCKGVPFGNAKPGTACDTGDVGVCIDGKYEVDCSCKRITEPGTEICDGKDNDCDGQVDENTDVCGICGGDGKSCLDCAGTPFGKAVKDACGVCNGDGKSCADCAGTPNGTAVKDKCGVCNGDNTSCLDCVEDDISDDQFEMDHGAKLHEKLIKKMLRTLTNLDKSAETLSYSRTTASKTHTLQLRNWVLSWTLQSKILICGNTALCTQVSNFAVTDEYITHSVELRDIGREVIAKLKKLKYNTKKLARENENRHNTNVGLAKGIPATFSTGCNIS